MQWPDGKLLHHRASPAHGYDLCYSARPGNPVTLLTARQGLRFTAQSVELGVLLRPVATCSDGFVVWTWANAMEARHTGAVIVETVPRPASEEVRVGRRG